MKILIYGAGVLGSLYAARLANAGNHRGGDEVGSAHGQAGEAVPAPSISLLARGERLAQLRTHGLLIENADTGQRISAPVRLVERLEPDDSYDLIIVLMRKNQVGAILPLLAANRNTPNVLFMTNNAAGPEAYIAALGRQRVLLGFPGAGGVRAGHVMRTHIVSGGTQPTTLGELDGSITPRLTQIAAVFARAGFPVAISSNMDAWLKTHVALVSPIANALYLAGGDIYRLARTRDGLVLAIRAIREGLHVLQALHIPITPPRYRIFARLPEPLLVALLQRGFATEGARLSIEGHANAARDEMQQLADEFRTLAQSTAVATPAIERLYRYLDPATPAMADGSATIPLNWQALAMASGALAGAVLGGSLLRLNRRFGIAGGALAGLALGQNLFRARRMPLAATWQRELAQRHGPIEAARLLEAIEARYDQLYAERKQYHNPAVREHLKTRILPGLALYQSLRDSMDQAAALDEVQALFQSVFAWQRQQIEQFRQLPEPFSVFRPLVRFVTRRFYPPEGWEIEWVEDSEQRLAYNIRRCIYLETVNANAAPELAPLFCGLDDWIFAALPPSIAWERSTTLARGGQHCDFCWRRVAVHGDGTPELAV